MWRALRRCAAGAVSAGAVVLLAGGCGGVYHLHPNTGQAFYKIMRMHRSGPFPQPQMIGDDAEAALENLDKASRTSDMKRGGGPSFLLPLQR
jgi:hypothetical protein